MKPIDPLDDVLELLLSVTGKLFPMLLGSAERVDPLGDGVESREKDSYFILVGLLLEVDEWKRLNLDWRWRAKAGGKGPICLL